MEKKESQESGEEGLMELTEEQRDGYRTLLLSKLQKSRELEAERAKIKSDLRKAKKKSKAAKTSLVGYREQVFEKKSKVAANFSEVKNKAASLATEFTGLLLAPFEVKKSATAWSRASLTLPRFPFTRSFKSKECWQKKLRRSKQVEMANEWRFPASPKNSKSNEERRRKSQ
ncbi:Oidioi.mRNA.OKI2018_I69.XSR.g13431.t1.cds [Oikopleura dioica]|uniref:Oidioi.mRNA.OKI2018_I69.XSR.g13431.t1.cds n=1 Tax=Oikopleura dioica TaxID=34765 RepID=A0ABN7SAK7_OIKDI|nr:Oidioi.mRNA.OKI2018_I69.XSR.g13431.t1.cds [Oikopleura dioica]